MRFEALRERLPGAASPLAMSAAICANWRSITPISYARPARGRSEPEEAGIRARDRLGDDAIWPRRCWSSATRSISARFPGRYFRYAVTGGLYRIVAAALLLLGLSKFFGFWMGASEFAVPGWYRLLAELLLSAVNFAMMPLATLLLTVLVWRQRLSALVAAALLSYCCRLSRICRATFPP